MHDLAEFWINFRTNYLFYVVMISAALHLASMFYSAYKACTLKGRKFDLNLFSLMVTSQFLMTKPQQIDDDDLEEAYLVAITYNKIPLAILILSTILLFLG